MQSNHIPIYTSEDFEGMRKAGSLASKILDQLREIIKPGISTQEINDYCKNKAEQNSAVCAPYNYGEIPGERIPFPKHICTSKNEIVCHGIPSEKDILLNGDIINVDVTVIVDGWFGDSSRMFQVGEIDKKKYKLLKTTYECLNIGIKNAIPGNTLGDIGYKIQNYAQNKKYSVVKEFCGHGIGREFHTPPSVLHYGKKGEGTKLEPGMIFTIEPMINIGGWETEILSDGWTAVTQDRSLSAQFEHTIGITEKGNEIFTLSHNNSDFPINVI